MVAKIKHKLRSKCPIACSLDVVGDHWTLLIIRSLMFSGIHEYKDMLQMDEQISSGILTNRLKMLTEEGIITSAPHPASQRRKLYYLTSKGKGLIHVLTHLAAWSGKYLKGVPPEHTDFSDYDPQHVIQKTLKDLEDWEEENGLPSA